MNTLTYTLTFTINRHLAILEVSKELNMHVTDVYAHLIENHPILMNIEEYSKDTNLLNKSSVQITSLLRIVNQNAA